MASFNKVLLVGNLTRDPALKYLPGGTAVAEFGLAVNRKYKTASGEAREEVTFVDCAAFGKTGETINEYCKKGKSLLVEGRLKFDQWEDKNGGGKRSKLSVIVEGFQFLNSSPTQAEGEQQSSPPARQQAPTPAPAEAPYGDEQQFKDDDIPF